MDILKRYFFDPERPPVEYQELAVVSGSWFDMGRQYVQQCREGFLARAANNYSAFLEFFGSKEKVYDTVNRYLLASKAEFPQLLELIRGMAEESGLDPEECVIVLYGISMLRAERECSHVSAWGSATANGHLLCAGNMDLGYDAREYLPAVLAYPEDGKCFISGDLFHRDGINEDGVILQGSGSQNSGEGGMIKATAAEPRHMWNDANIYGLAFSSSAKEAREKLLSWKYVAGCNQFIGDLDHDCSITEFNATLRATRRAGDLGETDFILENNGTHAPGMESTLYTGKAYWDDTDPRYWSAEQYVKEHLGKITLDTLFQAQSLNKFYVPEGWSYTMHEEWGVNVWRHDDSNPFPCGWHEDWSLAHSLWPTQLRAPDFRPCIRHLMDAEDRIFCTMKGSSLSQFSCNPHALGTYWKVQLGGGPADVSARAKAELELQLWIAGRDISTHGDDSGRRLPYLDRARELMYEGINYRSLALCAEKLGSSIDEVNQLYAKALSAFCGGQCYARKAQNDPTRFEQEL